MRYLGGAATIPADLDLTNPWRRLRARPAPPGPLKRKKNRPRRAAEGG